MNSAAVPELGMKATQLPTTQAITAAKNEVFILLGPLRQKKQERGSRGVRSCC